MMKCSDADVCDAEARVNAVEKAHAILGVKGIRYLRLADIRMDNMPLLDVARQLEPVVDEIRPSHIDTHHQGDLNIDHYITHQAVMTAFHPVPDFIVKETRYFEVLSSTARYVPTFEVFQPRVFVDISAYLGAKVSALSAYGHEMWVAPHSRSLEHAELLAQHRGYCVGLAAAEAFMLVRAII